MTAHSEAFVFDRVRQARFHPHIGANGWGTVKHAGDQTRRPRVLRSRFQTRQRPNHL
ncbi:hypothetical protein [Pseudofrankia saprophytica]|uniref:hypothetical protein n=1 Tax=Pseudofrankia saprophytica TaxID=298655 RepID=UPI0002D9B3FE|nr:hypothetical protein [Pseudofrankia saprophytica]